MKIKITLKDPDGVYDSLQKAAEESVDEITGIDEDEKEELIERRKEKISESIEKWVEYDEYVTIEIDTDNNTAKVLPVK